jgi:hypothetical protein
MFVPDLVICMLGSVFLLPRYHILCLNISPAGPSVRPMRGAALAGAAVEETHSSAYKVDVQVH